MRLTVYVCVCACKSKWVVAEPTAKNCNLFSERRNKKKKKFHRLVCQGLGCVRINVFVRACANARVPIWMHLCLYSRCTCTCMHWDGLANKYMCVWVGVLFELETYHFHFFPPQLSLSSPKIGCTPFVTSHECLLNLLWRDLGANLFPVEKAKLWNNEP